MPRRARITLPGVAHHLIQRGNNRQACFFAPQDYALFLRWLGEHAEEAQCLVHAYVLMTNHLHLLVTPAAPHGVGQLMKRVGQRYVQHVNRRYERTGSLWEGRFRSCLVEGSRYALACYRYIELNPVRAGIVASPVDYPWSSYRFNARPASSALISPHPAYVSLGSSPLQRAQRYRGLFEEALAPSVIDEFRAATNGNLAVGDDGFKQGLEKTLGIRARRGRPGRPRRR